ncbi:MAG TPA: DUF898 family protein [Ferruginibacter sp.]|jgi:uncharacterized membrane protein YjgN (DUF898 family)|nr:DUF898 family protein [Ferruginibacter sp.]
METTNYQLSFFGKGGDFFKIKIVNIIFSICTLGLYYPWAKAKTLSYLYSHTSFEDQPFAFTGTGKEMFKGFIRAFLLIIILYGLFIYSMMSKNTFLFLIVYLLFLAIIPVAIHGFYKYRMAKTTWRGIRFGYAGDRTELFVLYILGLLLTLITVGIYGFWFHIKLRKYIIGNIKVGNASFHYTGDGTEYFLLNLKGIALTIITLGIYIFWWEKDLFSYYVNKLELTQGDKKVEFASTMTGGSFALLLITNMLIFIFTLGIGFAWIQVRTLKFIANNISLSGDYSFDELQQTQQNYTDATGEDIADLLDLGFTI